MTRHRRIGFIFLGFVLACCGAILLLFAELIRR
jgi:hypothetical protein